MSSDLEQLIAQCAKLPGLGKRSARRLVLHLLTNKESIMQPLTSLMSQVAEVTLSCTECGNLDTSSPCHICANPKQQARGTICVVEQVADLWALERSGAYQGLYHVLGGTLSAIERRGPDDLFIDKLIERAHSDTIHEVILATSATVDGQTTAHYLTERLQDANVTVSQLAQGIPFGGELDYLDEGTIGAALAARKAS